MFPKAVMISSQEWNLLSITHGQKSTQITQSFKLVSDAEREGVKRSSAWTV
jgi:hypothetical protein